MKKTLLFLSLMGIISSSFAQSAKFGIKAGVNFSSLSAAYSGGSVNSSNITGYHVGVVADFSTANFSVQPGLLFTTKGASGATLNYIEVPVNLLYNVPVAAVGKTFFGAGPYLGYGVSVSNGGKFGNGINDVANPDFGINFLGGFRFDTGFMISAGYGMGLSNLNNDTSNGNISVKNRVVNLSIGYFF